MIGALQCESITETWTYAPAVESGYFGPKGRLVQKAFKTRAGLFEDIALSSIVLNVSLLDCHPMINLEAQALGRACLRGPLYLDSYEDHPYVALTEVKNVNSWVDITAAISRSLAVPRAEMSELIADYSGLCDTLAVARYAEFLGI